MWRKENQALTKLELEARDRKQRLLERANALRMEQDDEIKKLNQVKYARKQISMNVWTSVPECLLSVQLVLSAQCQATRDAQIQEKKRIQLEMSEEEKRLDAMMEVERRKALDTVEQIDELRKVQRIR